MAWVLLLIAGLLEVAWASLLPATEGLRRLWPTIAFLVLLAGSMVLLARATETIPIGTGYAVWVGVGAAGTAIVGIVVHDDPATAARIGFLVLLIVAVVGLRVTGDH